MAEPPRPRSREAANRELDRYALASELGRWLAERRKRKANQTQAKEQKR